MSITISPDLQDFAKENGIDGLTQESLKNIQAKTKGYTIQKGKEFLVFQDRINSDLLKHRVIVENKFCDWFAKGEMNEKQAQAFLIQFSVFSNLFLIAQLKKMLNADTLEGMRSSKEILANEIGVIFKSEQEKISKEVQDKDREGDPALVNTEGTIQGSKFKFEAAHFEWLYGMAIKLGLDFEDIGKRRHGTKSTLFFCDELARLYGHEDYPIAQAASYAVENWAASGFWKELVKGWTAYRDKHVKGLPLAFFTWHDKVEDQHALHTQEELEEYFFEHTVNQDEFIKNGNEMLDGVAAFWDGLEEQRLELG